MISFPKIQVTRSKLYNHLRPCATDLSQSLLRRHGVWYDCTLPCSWLVVENTQNRSVRTTMHYKTTVAAKGTFHWSMEVVRNQVTRHTMGCQTSPDAWMPITVVTLQVVSKNDNEPHQHVARHPRLSSHPQNHPDPVLFVHFWSKPFNQHRGPRPRAHWYMCLIEEYDNID